MDNDDALVGRLLGRREAMALLGSTSIAFAAGGWRAWPGQIAPAAGCVVRPELTEGPFFLDRALDRSDIRTSSRSGSAREGAPLTLSVAVSQIAAGRCAPLPGAVVHVWQCDAVGVYAGVADSRTGSANAGDDALRGTQATNAGGTARFTTIYPGWYRGRAVHIHFKIRTQAAGGGAYEYTSQLFFPEDLTDQIHAQAPYAAHGRRDTTNQRDGIYRQGGAQLLLAPTPTASGYAATISIALDLTDAAVGRADGAGRRGRRGGA